MTEQAGRFTVISEFRDIIDSFEPTCSFHTSPNIRILIESLGDVVHRSRPVKFSGFEVLRQAEPDRCGQPRIAWILPINALIRRHFEQNAELKCPAGFYRRSVGKELDFDQSRRGLGGMGFQNRPRKQTHQHRPQP